MKKLFGTDGIRGTANIYPLTIEICSKLCEALVKKFCIPNIKNTVLIGKDTRISSDMFEHAIAATLSSCGVNVKLIGICPTPAVSILTKATGASFGIMISASHNIFSDNGIKIFNKNGLKLSDSEEEEIESIIFNSNLNHKDIIGEKIGTIQYDCSLIEIYIKTISTKFSFTTKETSDFKIVIDSANGSFAKIAPNLLKNLGFNVISINDAPNGININDKCGVIYPQTISSNTISNNADIGIAFDGDGDRLLLCDETGAIIDGDHILAALVKAYSIRNTEVVSTIMTNLAFEQYLKKENIKCIKTNVGDRYIAEYMKAHDILLGGEPSGHIIIKDHALTGDGLFAAIKILEYLIQSKQKASTISNIFKSYPSINRNVVVKDKTIISRSDILQLIENLRTELGNTGKLIVRASGTESIIRITAEGSDKNQLLQIINKVYSVIEKAS